MTGRPGRGPAPDGLRVIPLAGLPEVGAGDDLAALLLAGVAAAGERLAEGDVLAVSSKVAAKALDLVADPRDRLGVIAAQTVSVVSERRSGEHLTRVVRCAAGPVMAAAGVDASNTGGRDVLLLLPHDPDGVCRALHTEITAATGVARLAVLLTDTAGRPWRAGQTDFALGAHGLRVVDDLRGSVDADGRTLQVTTRAVADEIAAAADLVKGKTARVAAAIVRGCAAYVLDPQAATGAPGARDLVRSGPGDWFALGAQEAVRAALGVPPGTALAERVGIRPVGPDSVAAQVDRAVAVALAGGLDAGVDVGSDRLVVSGADPVVVGMVAARLSVALAGEQVDHEVVVGDPVVLRLTGAPV